MAEQGLTKFEIMQRKMAEKQRKREEARKNGGAGGGGKKKRKKKQGGGGGGKDPSEKGLSKFEIMQKRMAEKQKMREEKKRGGGGASAAGSGRVTIGPTSKIKTSSGGGTSSSSDEDRRHRKAMTTRINMNAVREMDAKNDSESDEEERNEPFNRIGSRRETAQKNAKLRKDRRKIEILTGAQRHTMDRPLSQGDAVIFYSRADKQYIPGIVDSIQKSGKETFYKLNKKYKSSFDPVKESKRLGKKVTMDDDPDRYRRTDKPALIKKDTYYSILTNNDFDIELRLALLRIYRDKLKSNLAKYKKKADKVARINAIVSQYGKDGGGHIGVNYDESILDSGKKKPEEKVKNKPRIPKSRTQMRVTQDAPSSTRVTREKKKPQSKQKQKGKQKHNDKNTDESKSSLAVNDNNNSSKRRKGGRTKSTNHLPTESAMEKSSSSTTSSRNKRNRKQTMDRKKSPKVNKSPKVEKRKSRETDTSGGDDSDASSSKNKGSKKKGSKKKGGGGGDAFGHLLPSTDVSEWSMGDISKWLMYLSSSPFVPPDEDDSDADELDEDELELMAKKKTKLFDKYFQYFVAAQIDGPALLALTKKTLAKTCKVKNSTDRTLLWQAIQELKSGKVRGGSKGSGGSSKKKDSSSDSSDDEKEKEKQKEKAKEKDDDGYRPLKKFEKKPPARMQKTKTVTSVVGGGKKKEISLRVGGGNKGRGPRPISARRDHEHSTQRRKRFHDSDDDLSDENIDSESGSDDEPLTYKMMDKNKNGGKKRPVKDSGSLARKLGGWDSDSD